MKKILFCQLLFLCQSIASTNDKLSSMDVSGIQLDMKKSTVMPIFAHTCEQIKAKPKIKKRDDGLLIAYCESPYEMTRQSLKVSFLSAAEMIYLSENLTFPKELKNTSSETVQEYYRKQLEARYGKADTSRYDEENLYLCWGTPCTRNPKKTLTTEELSQKILTIDIFPNTIQSNRVVILKNLSYLGAMYVGNRIEMQKELQQK